MLELLLVQYKEMFGEDFPLVQFAGRPEIEVINVIYDCVRYNRAYDPTRTVRTSIDGAPTSK